MFRPGRYNSEPPAAALVAARAAEIQMRDRIVAMLESMGAEAWKGHIEPHGTYRVRGSELIDIFPVLADNIRQIKPQTEAR